MLRIVATAGIGLVVLASVPAQYVNRATYLGREQEGVRPDFRRGNEYFVDRQSYVEPPPWRDGDPWLGNRIDLAGGSVTRTELTLEGVVNARAALGSGFTGGFHYLQSEHHDARFARSLVELERDLGAGWSALFQLEGVADKSQDDLSIGAGWAPRPAARLRAWATLVDFPADRERDTRRYLRRPYAVAAAGEIGDPRGWYLRFEVASQLPLRERLEDRAADLDLHRTLGRVELRAPIGERDALLAGLEGEYTVKHLRTDAAGDPAREDFDRDAQLVRLGWWRRLDGGRDLALGASWRHVREDGWRPNDPAADLEIRRTEALLSARVRLPLGRGWSCEPTVLGGLVRYERRSAADGRRTADFQGKAGLPLVYAFGERASLLLNAMIELDDPGFGGGGVHFVARF